MVFELPKLNYNFNDLSPVFSEETLEYHYLKHHKTYVDNLNSLIVWTEFADLNLEEIIMSSSGPIFNNSAQIWNHTFYFAQFSRDSKILPESVLKDSILNKWWTFDNFQAEFKKSALWNFWSWWTWLVKNISTWELTIMNTWNAASPITDTNLKPLLTCDVWEHAYYIDYRNKRAVYVDNFWKIIDWEIISNRI